MRSLECVSFDGLDRTRNLNRLDGVIVNKCIRADAGHAILNDNMFHHQVSPGGIKPDNPGVPVAIHCAGAADGQRTRIVQCPGNVAAVTFRAAGTAIQRFQHLRFLRTAASAGIGLVSIFRHGCRFVHDTVVPCVAKGGNFSGIGLGAAVFRTLARPIPRCSASGLGFHSPLFKIVNSRVFQSISICLIPNDLIKLVFAAEIVDFLQTDASIKSTIEIRCISRERDALEVGAVGKNAPPQICYAVRNRSVLQTGAKERPSSNACYPFRNNHTGQFIASIKCIITDEQVRCAIWKLQTCQCSFLKSSTANIRNAVRNRHVR